MQCIRLNARTGPQPVAYHFVHVYAVEYSPVNPGAQAMELEREWGRVCFDGAVIACTTPSRLKGYACACQAAVCGAFCD